MSLEHFNKQQNETTTTETTKTLNENMERIERNMDRNV